jgi:hypothetical protein
MVNSFGFDALRCIGRLGFFEIQITGIGAAAAGFGTTDHFCAADTFAGFRACFAYFCTGAGNHIEHRGAAEQEIGRRLADGYTIQHKFNMPLFHMAATHLEAAIEKRFLAFRTAIPAGLDGGSALGLIVKHKISSGFQGTDD